MAERAELLAALKGLRTFFNNPGEDSLDAFERVADAFRRETGYLRPGKDCVIHDHAVRAAAWEVWVAGKIAAADAAIAISEGESK